MDKVLGAVIMIEAAIAVVYSIGYFVSGYYGYMIPVAASVTFAAFLTRKWLKS